MLNYSVAELRLPSLLTKMSETDVYSITLLFLNVFLFPPFEVFSFAGLFIDFMCNPSLQIAAIMQEKQTVNQ